MSDQPRKYHDVPGHKNGLYVGPTILILTLLWGCTDIQEQTRSADAAPDGLSTVALVGATILDGTGQAAIPNGNILINEDRIACVGSADACPVPANAETVDVTGKWVTPGLVDSHVHFMQTGWFDGRPDGINATEIFPYPELQDDLRSNPGRWHRSYLCSGITAVYDVGGQQWTLALGAQAENDPGMAHVRAAGPLVTHAGLDLLNTESFQTFFPMSDAQEGRESVSKLKESGSTAVKVWYLAPPEERQAELDEAILAVGDEARAQGLPLIVHATSLREAKVAIRAGAELLVHSVFDDEIDDEFIQMVVDNRVIYSPTIIVGPNWGSAFASVALNAPNLADDPNNCVDPETRQKIANIDTFSPYLPEWTTPEWAQSVSAGRSERIAHMQRDLLKLYQAGAIIATGTDAGNPLTLHGPSIYAEMEAMQDAGIPAADIIVMSTRNGARAMDRLDDFGTLETGKLADLIVLAADPSLDVANFRRIEQVMRAGVMHSISELSFGRSE